MTRDTMFICEISAFVKDGAMRYTKSVNVIWSDDRRSCMLVVDCDMGEHWEIPIVQISRYLEDCIAGIDIGDAGALPLTLANYYAYLWVKAAGRCRKLTNR